MSMRFKHSSGLTLGLILLLAGSAFAADDSVIRGQTLYRDNCKSCHEAGSANGEYTPMTLIGVQWERFFDRKYERSHRDVISDIHGGQPVTEGISDEILETIRNFSIDHAADSENPMTCG